MDYDIVIATRNRCAILRHSLPTILTQKPGPKNIIFVDASDDHGAVATEIEKLCAGKVNFKVINCQKANSSEQRNLGLEYVESEIVILPDDDSLWWPGAFDAMLRIYERDEEKSIVGVCGMPTTTVPAQANIKEESSPKMTRSDKFCIRFCSLHNKLTSHICPDPFIIHGRSYWNRFEAPEWISDFNAVQVEYMGGYRMSFRTDTIRGRGFDPDLGHFMGYAKCEDVDACFSVANEGLLVAAKKARVNHYKFPGPRADGYKLGLIGTLNLVYVVLKHSHEDDCVRKYLKRYCKYKYLQRLIQSGSSFGKARLRGTRVALRYTKELIRVSPSKLRETYLSLCEESLKAYSKGA